MKLFDRLFGRKSSDFSIPNATKPCQQTIPGNDASKNGSAAPKSKQSWESLSEGFIVTDTESARQFFMACDGDYNIMTEHFSSEVYKSFEKFADYKTRCAFTKEFALKKFNSVLEGKKEYLPSIAAQVYSVARYWGMDFYDEEFIEKLNALAKLSNERSPKTKDTFGKDYPTQFQHDTWIKNYLSQYNNRGEGILKVQPLVEMTYEYLTGKYPDNHDYYIDEIIKLCSTLRGLILEMQSPDTSLGMKFALSDKNDIDKIIAEFSAICKGSAGHIKGMIHQLNCVYGIRTPAFFLTAANPAVDYGSNHSWDIFKFAVVFYQENLTAVFECWRDKDGYFYPESKFREQYPILLKYKRAIAQAIAFYRNRSASETFRKGLTDDYANSNYERQKTLCRRYGECFAYLRERIQNQSIKDTLNELLDCCEEVSPIIGIDQTTFYKPATEQEIQECEGRTGIIIPQPMREFLMFSNGASLFENSTTIYSVSEIGKYTLDGYDDEKAKLYIPIGDFIGDGTIFVLNKTNGDVAEYDHETGEVTIYGNFEDFLGEIMEFHCQDYID